jgi:hypothetical protein
VVSAEVIIGQFDGLMVMSQFRHHGDVRGESDAMTRVPLILLKRLGPNGFREVDL